jgi:signal transduction histidine kinase
VQIEADTEVLRLRTVLRDIVALSAIPAAWIGREPPAIAAGLADALVGLLQLDFVFVRLTDPDGAGAVEASQGSAWTRFPQWLEAHAASAPFPRKEIVADAGNELVQRRGFAVPVGVNGEQGVVAAAAERRDFPTPIDQLLLSLAANHAAGAFQNARLIHERKRAAEALREARNELEVRVTERTAELHVANDELSALRRVATLVAEGVEPHDLFAVVAEEVARVVEVPLMNVARYDADGTVTLCASFSAEGPVLPVGTRLSLEGTSVLRLVRESSEVARIDDYSRLDGEAAEFIRRSGVRSAVGVPIVVAGRPWGAMLASSRKDEPLPQGTEARLADFTELVATAIENAESREALGRLADEQAALRRVATLVAQGVRPDEIFSAVSDEVGRLLSTNMAAVVRFEAEVPGIVLVGVSKGIEAGIAIGTRWTFEDARASAEVYRTGRPARVNARGWPAFGGRVAVAGHDLGVVSTVAAPIVVEGGLWGAVTISAREQLPLDTEDRLETFTELVATAIANADSRAELAASRRRIVAASDEARRRIERDLHDGTQQRLVSLELAARNAEAHLPSERDDLRLELSRLATGLADAVTELQELSRGIHPAILSHGGLGAAVGALARRSPIPVELDDASETRLPEPIEVAAYFVVSEALANAAKHARASRTEVSIARRDRSLWLSIRDDGVGGADPARGSGLLGLADRVEALGGSIQVRSLPGDGTHIIAELPLEFDVGSDPGASAGD